ncbi:hypothetical protein HETIRDRAFT_440939 [Heterobasidion irregulare TC 32-1]|uniref:Uncharacterized protein n=1 Tax=Heterobasidion irregulare (strain TC 32-1) TaxID=747525 RepID=W4JY48_HETIT|nr:uncharacterized protein HETIRDRAFT_440939 [Heterobasidion irregulare TC 32-1]ETW78507.1 hypothetical protein HETIRDRAFT_440939 [Heterobasidion irregulare TC 32-1]
MRQIPSSTPFFPPSLPAARFPHTACTDPIPTCTFSASSPYPAARTHAQRAAAPPPVLVPSASPHVPIPPAVLACTHQRCLASSTPQRASSTGCMARARSREPQYEISAVDKSRCRNGRVLASPTIPCPRQVRAARLT